MINPGLSIRSIAAAILCGLAMLLVAPRAFAETFQNPLIVPTFPDAKGLATGDLNHDGKSDLVYVTAGQNQLDTAHVLLGNGNGTFTHEQDIALPASVCCVITIADVNADGNPDIIMQGGKTSTGIVAVMIGNGDGTFQAPIVSTFAPRSSDAIPGFRGAIGVGDVNGDGNVDLVLPDLGASEIDILFGDGTGHFTISTELPFVNVLNDLYLTDLNGDGHLDFVVTDLLGATFYVYLGNGDGTFQNPVTYTGQPSTSALILTDLEGDGHPDMLAQYYPNNVAYFKGNADGTFGPLTPIGSANSSDPLVGVGDFNSDGIPDLVFTPATGIGVETTSSVLNYTALKLTVSGRAPAPPAIAIRPVMADFNGDGHLDIAMPVEGGIAILLGQGNGTFASANAYDMGQEVGAAAVADFNGDGHPDIAVTLPATFPRLLLGDGTGKFTLGPDPNASYASSGADVWAVAADFNGDGKADVSMGNTPLNGSTPGGQSIVLGNGNGTFSTPVSVPDGSPVVADLNGDGRSDMVSLANGIVASLGQADGSFTTVTTPFRTLGVSNAYNVGDVNNDGKPDLVINYNDHLEVWLGNGDGSFTYLDSISPQGISGDGIAAIADLDGDGNADVILAPGPGLQVPLSPLVILYGNGDGTFQAPVYLAISHPYSQVVVKDINGDSKPDLVMTDGTGIAVVMNLGNREFGPEEDYVGGASISELSVKDVNGDGFPDIVAANEGGTTVAVLLNEPNAVSPAGEPVSGALSVSPSAPVVGQPIAFSLTVAAQTAGGPVPTGTASFYIDGTFEATVSLASGTATYNFTGTLIPIQHTVVATYNGDLVYAARSFAAVFSVQPPTYATNTTLTVSPTVLLASQTVRLTAKVGSSVAVPGGMVTFLDGGQVIGSAAINSNQVAYFDTALLGAGAHSLSAKYDGYTEMGYNDPSAFSYVAANFSPSTSPGVSVTVNVNATGTSLSASGTSVTAGAVETFTAKVNSSGGTPYGGVSFFDGSTLLGTMSLDANATADYSTASLSAGTHSIVATFNANGPFGVSNSLPLSVTVTSASSTLQAVAVSLGPQTDATSGQSTLAAMASTPVGPARGVVTFLDDGRILGRVETDAEGKAILAIGTLASGVHDFTASFAGGPGVAPAVSPEIYDRWPSTGPGFSVSTSSGVLDLSASKPATIQIGVAPLAGFRETVQLSCIGGLPTDYTCSFSPASLKGGSSRLTIASTNRTAAVPLVRMPWYWLLLALILLGWLAAAGWSIAADAGSRRLRRALLLLAACCAVGALAGCAARFSTSSERILTIQAKSGSGADAVVHSTQVTLRIH